MFENRDRNLYKNELEKKVAFNIPLGLIFAQIWSDLGFQIFFIFLFSGLAVCPNLGLQTKWLLGGLLDRFLIDFWLFFVCFLRRTSTQLARLSYIQAHILLAFGLQALIHSCHVACPSHVVLVWWQPRRPILPSKQKPLYQFITASVVPLLRFFSYSKSIFLIINIF